MAVSGGGLNPSPLRTSCVHPRSINVVDYDGHKMPRLEGGFRLRCFSRYPYSAWLLGNALPDNPYTRGADPPFLSYLRDLPLRHQSASTKKQQTCLTTV